MKPYEQMSRDELLHELNRKNECAERNSATTLRLLNLLNSGSASHELMASLLCFFQELSGCDAVGIRLAEGADYPYFETRGFPADFVQGENYLCTRDLNGQLTRDGIGNPILECICGNVLCGRFDPEQPFYTDNGSFWCNSTSDLLATVTEGELMARTRNRCNRAGYESVALIPLRNNGSTIGLMQFNDRRRGRFSADFITQVERLADSMAIAVVRREAEQALRMANNYNRSLIEASLDLLVAIGPDGRITDVNRATELATERSREELIGTVFADYFTEPDRARAVHRLVFQLVQVRDYAMHIRRSDGAPLPVLYNASVYRDASGRAVGVLATARDITERKKMQDALIENQRDLQLANECLEQRVGERTAELQDAIREQESFSYSVSHDLRAPLRHMNSFSAMLIEDFGDQLPPQALHYLGRISAASNRMGVLIDHLLELSRVTRAKTRMGAVDLSELAAATLCMFRETEPERRVEETIENGVTVLGDKSLLRQLLDNLLGNAWKYSSKNPSARIAFGKTRVSGQETYFVSDNGAGFDMAYRERLFKAFERLHGAEFEGVGIGLATAQQIVKRHGGRIWAEGIVNEGATFYFTLPPCMPAHG